MGLQDRADHRLLQTVARAEEGRRGTERRELARDVIEDELLRRGQPAGSRRIGRGREMERDPALLALAGHRVAPLRHDLPRHVTRERVVDEIPGAHPLRHLDHGGGARGLIRPQRDVAGRTHGVRILVWGDEADSHVGTRLTDLARRRRRSRDRLAHDDHADPGIGGEPGELSDHGLELAREVVGIGDVHDAPGIPALHLLAGTEIRARQGCCARHDADLERLRRSRVRRGGVAALPRAACERGQERRARDESEDPPRNQGRAPWGRRRR